jgi:hypothetical protein
MKLARFRVVIVRVGVATVLAWGALDFWGDRSVAWATPAADEDLNNRGVELRSAGRDQEARDHW